MLAVRMLTHARARKLELRAVRNHHPFIRLYLTYLQYLLCASRRIMSPSIDPRAPPRREYASSSSPPHILSTTRRQSAPLLIVLPMPHAASTQSSSVSAPDALEPSMPASWTLLVSSASANSHSSWRGHTRSSDSDSRVQSLYRRRTNRRGRSRLRFAICVCNFLILAWPLIYVPSHESIAMKPLQSFSPELIKIFGWSTDKY